MRALIALGIIIGAFFITFIYFSIFGYCQIPFFTEACIPEDAKYYLIGVDLTSSVENILPSYQSDADKLIDGMKGGSCIRADLIDKYTSSNNWPVEATLPNKSYNDLAEVYSKKKQEIVDQLNNDLEDNIYSINPGARGEGAAIIDFLNAVGGAANEGCVEETHVYIFSDMWEQSDKIDFARIAWAPDEATNMTIAREQIERINKDYGLPELDGVNIHVVGACIGEHIEQCAAVEIFWTELVERSGGTMCTYASRYKTGIPPGVCKGI